MNSTVPISEEFIAATKAKINAVLFKYFSRFFHGHAVWDVSFDAKDFSFSIEIDGMTGWFTIDFETDGNGILTEKWTVTAWTPIPSENSASDKEIAYGYRRIEPAVLAILGAYYKEQFDFFKQDVSNPEEPV